MSDLGIVSIILSSGWFARLILLILLGFSIVSIAVIIDRWRYMRAADQHMRSFRGLFGSGGLVNLTSILEELPEGPMSRLAEAAIDEYELSFQRRANPGPAIDAPEDASQAARARLGLANVERAMESAAADEIGRAEQRLVVLATTGAVSPFFGLLGTVWGVMSAFVAMGMQSSASLAVVAPGIAEALITTIFGLGAAIPAVIAYNVFQGRVRALDDELEAFSRDLQNAFARQVLR
ncbi:MAG: MotA/TolQ/ExbB proton channel family protein [Candidatus Eiseniibacteriota bacterium]|jgi:biopolymer transport protein TolQ